MIFVLENAGASRYHARIIVRDSRVYVHDLGSTNGTYVGRERIEKKKLSADENVIIGSAILRVVYRAAGEAPLIENTNGHNSVDTPRVLQAVTENEEPVASVHVSEASEESDSVREILALLQDSSSQIVKLSADGGVLIESDVDQVRRNRRISPLEIKDLIVALVLQAAQAENSNFLFRGDIFGDHEVTILSSLENGIFFSNSLSQTLLE